LKMIENLRGIHGQLNCKWPTTAQFQPRGFVPSGK
jgi:hypothetical protein